jgi:hypothetical protein
MKRLILLVFLYPNALGAMEERKHEKIYLRIIVDEKNKDFLDSFFRGIKDEREKNKIKWQRECHISFEQAKIWANEFIQQDICSSCGLLQGFVGDRGNLENIVKLLIVQHNFKIMYHDKEPSYERIGLTDDLLFLGGFAYMQDCENKREIRDRLKKFRELPFFEEELGAYFTDSESNQGKKEHEEKVLSGCSKVKKDEGVSASITQEAFILVRSKRSLRGIKRFNRLLLPKDLLSVSSESSSISSCSSRTTGRYIDHAPSPLCLPVCPMKNEKIVQIIEKSE